MTETESATASRHHIGIMCTIDRHLHQIDELVFAAGLATGSGQHAALCGRVVTAASLTDPPGLPCSLCSAILTRGPSITARQVRRTGWLWR